MSKFQMNLLKDPDTSYEQKFKTVFAMCTRNTSGNKLSYENLNAEKLAKCLKVIADSVNAESYGAISINENGYALDVGGQNYTGQTATECIQKFLNYEFVKYLEALEAFNEKNKKGSSDIEEMPQVVCVADIDKKEIKYLLEPYIIRNNVTVLAGDGGIGKTFIWIDIASAITKGVLPEVMGLPKEFNEDVKVYDWDDEIETDYPNRDQGNNHRVLYLTSEDNTAEILRERFEKADADLENLICVPLEDEHFHEIMLDSPQLEQIIAKYKPALVVFDPLQSFVHGKMAERNNMRQQLDCLTRLAKVYDTSFLVVVHTNKTVTLDARTKLSDSSDIWDKSRSVLFVGRTNEPGIRYLSQEKGNYTTDGNELGTQLFTIKDGRIEHRGTTDKKYADFVAEAACKKETTVKDVAKDYILQTLTECGEMLVSDLDESALSIGTSKKTLERAKGDLFKDKKIRYRKEGLGKGKGVKCYISLYPYSDGGTE